MSTVSLTLHCRVGAGGAELNLTNGDRLYRDAVLFWKGREQIRDITIRADGSVSMGPDKSRRLA